MNANRIREKVDQPDDYGIADLEPERGAWDRTVEDLSVHHGAAADVDRRLRGD
jgi:hypothetical protein